MTDLISHQPEEILIKIFLMVGYQNNLPFISIRFRHITQIIDIQQINKLLCVLDYRGLHDLPNNPIKLINDYTYKTYILGPVYTYYNFNILDIKETFSDIEQIRKYEIIREIKNKYKISVNDIVKIFNIVINNMNLNQISIVKKIYQTYFDLNCMFFLLIDDIFWIVNYILNEITTDDIKMLNISKLNSNDFSLLSITDYEFYYKQLICNIEKVIESKTLFIYNNRMIIGKRLNEFYDMIKKSEKFNSHLVILKML